MTYPSFYNKSVVEKEQMSIQTPLVLLYKGSGECLESQSLNNLFLVISVPCSFLSHTVIGGERLGRKRKDQ